MLLNSVTAQPALAGNFAGVTEPEQDSPDAETNTSQPQTASDAASASSIASKDVDLDAFEKDLTGVEIALSRLAEGTYWTDEVTGSPLPDDLLATDPIARRA